MIQKWLLANFKTKTQKPEYINILSELLYIQILSILIDQNTTLRFDENDDDDNINDQNSAFLEQNGI